MEKMEQPIRTGKSSCDMNEQPLTEDNFCRVSRAIIEKHGCTYSEALNILNGLRLNLICGEEIRHSISLQAALLTAVNAGKRCFLGGVSVVLPKNVANLLPWPTESSLNQVVTDLGAVLATPSYSSVSHTLYFGAASDPVEDGLSVVCSGWRGGVAPADQHLSLQSSYDFATGGVLAGSLGVAKGFFRVTGLSSRFVTEPQGLSLWRPDVNWLKDEADGPRLEILPLGMWLLGLGHLGQAYVWNLGLLPYPTPNLAKIFLQDFDQVVAANWNAGLLCDEASPGKLKTRLCNIWLEARGFRTRLVERPFDEMTRRTGEEPFIALCGFDNTKSRSYLEDAGFDLVVECGLGGGTSNFDDIVMHTFPDASRTAKALWGDEASSGLQPHSEAFHQAFHVTGDCGILLETLEGKAISSSFVGAYAGAMTIGELLRGLHGGSRCELVKVQLRSNDEYGVALLNEFYQNRFAKSGYLSVMTH
jgi:hypothetical protein